MSGDLQRFEAYIAAHFAQEDEALQQTQRDSQTNEMPAASINPQDGALLHWLVRSINAKNAVEIGTLAGYSGIWIARGLADGGMLYTVEVSSKHIEVARTCFDRAGVGEKVEIVQGRAREVLPKLTPKGAFDFVFIDTEKTDYLYYLEWATANLRPGGILTAHNAYRKGGTVNPTDDNDHIMRKFLETIAEDERLLGMVVPLGDGMTMALRV